MIPTGLCCSDKMNILLSTTYFGPVQWYQKLYRADEVWIERYETFQKQTYRNRCVIATTQGVQALTVPVERSTFFASKASKLERNVQCSTYKGSPHQRPRQLAPSALERSALGIRRFALFHVLRG